MDIRIAKWNMHKPPFPDNCALDMPYYMPCRGLCQASEHVF